MSQGFGSTFSSWCGPSQASVDAIVMANTKVKLESEDMEINTNAAGGSLT